MNEEKAALIACFFVVLAATVTIWAEKEQLKITQNLSLPQFIKGQARIN